MKVNLFREVYIVSYSTGSYDDYCTHNVCVCESEELAKIKCKEINKEHFTRNSKIDLSGDRSYWEIDEAFEDFKAKHSEDYENEFEQYDTFLDVDGNKLHKINDDWSKRQDEIDKNMERNWPIFVNSYYPEWTLEETIEQLNLFYDDQNKEYSEYGKAKYDKIDYYYD